MGPHRVTWPRRDAKGLCWCSPVSGDTPLSRDTPVTPQCRLTLSPKDEAAVAPLPGHMVEAQQRGVHAQVLAALPHLVGVAGADLGHQRHWGETAIAQPGTGPPRTPRWAASAEPGGRCAQGTWCLGGMGVCELGV